MELILNKKKAGAFVTAMEQLGEKFNDRYIEGKIEDYVKLDMLKGKLELTFIHPVPEMVQVACYMVFVDTLL
jgi:hypothetical protein